MKQNIKHVPTVGICIFMLLFAYSASLYPGGSIVNAESIGYDWFHNYWCDLMYAQSLNGQYNIARPYAVLGWVVLCMSILSILLSIIHQIYASTHIRSTLKVFALLAMVFGMLASTDYHDSFVILSFPFGAITVLCLAISALRSNSAFIKAGAWLVVPLLTASFIMYFTSFGLYWIGLTQKIALAASFIWIIAYHYSMDRFIPQLFSKYTLG